MSRILLIGEDRHLLSTRAAVLSKLDSVVTCASCHEALELFPAEEFDLLILCHTLRESDFEGVVLTAREWWPKVRILEMVRDAWMETPVRRGVTSACCPEPRKLVERTKEMLGASTGRAGKSQSADGKRPHF